MGPVLGDNKGSCLILLICTIVYNDLITSKCLLLFPHCFICLKDSI